MGIERMKWGKKRKKAVCALIIIEACTSGNTGLLFPIQAAQL